MLLHDCFCQSTSVFAKDGNVVAIVALSVPLLVVPSLVLLEYDRHWPGPLETRDIHHEQNMNTTAEQYE